MSEQSHVKLKDLSNQSAPLLITSPSLGNTKEPMKLADQVAQDKSISINPGVRKLPTKRFPIYPRVEESPTQRALINPREKGVPTKRFSINPRVQESPIQRA